MKQIMIQLWLWISFKTIFMITRMTSSLPANNINLEILFINLLAIDRITNRFSIHSEARNMQLSIKRKREKKQLSGKILLRHEGKSA